MKQYMSLDEIMRNVYERVESEGRGDHNPEPIQMDERPMKSKRKYEIMMGAEFTNREREEVADLFGITLDEAQNLILHEDIYRRFGW